MGDTDYLFPTRLRAEVGPVEADGVTSKLKILITVLLEPTRRS